MSRRRGRRANVTGRSDGSGQYVNFGYPLLQSPAFRSLSGAAVKVFIELRTHFNGSNNGKLALSLEQAAKLLAMGKATVARAFAELQAKGFVICTKRGQWYGRQASTWAITLLAIDGNLPTNDWKRWQPQRKRPAQCTAAPEKLERGSQAAP